MTETLILAGARTPFATWSSGTTGKETPGGALKELDPFDLGAVALKGALGRAGLAANRLGFLAFGNMYQAGPQGCYGARYVGLRAGAPPELPGVAVGLACGTGLLALATAAEAIGRGEAQIAAAVGADSPSRVRRDVFVPSFTDVSCGKHIAKTAEDRAAERGISREAMDAWARRSHSLARARAAALAEEIVPVGGLAADDAVLENPAPERFATAKPMFEDGPRLITAANVHAIVDGGSALVLAAPRAAAGRALGRLASTAIAAVRPEQMAFAAVPAVALALERARWRARDVDLWELNETFAAQVLLDRAELSVPEEKLNPRGGAIALGHPFGATGPRLVLSLLLELRRVGGRRGVAAISAGGGTGIAACVEAI